MVDLLLSIFITLRYFRRCNHFVYNNNTNSNNNNNNGGDDIHNNNVQHGTK